MQLIKSIKWALTKYKMRCYLKNKYKGSLKKEQNEN